MVKCRDIVYEWFVKHCRYYGTAPCVTTEARPLDRLGPLGEFEQDSNTDSELGSNTYTHSARNTAHVTDTAPCAAGEPVCVEPFSAGNNSDGNPVCCRASDPDCDTSGSGAPLATCLPRTLLRSAQCVCEMEQNVHVPCVKSKRGSPPVSTASGHVPPYPFCRLRCVGLFPVACPPLEAPLQCCRGRCSAAGRHHCCVVRRVLSSLLFHLF